MTLPDAVAAALAAKGVKFEMTGAEFLKQYTISAAMGEVGALRLFDAAQDFINQQDAVKSAAAYAAGIGGAGAGEAKGERLLFDDPAGGESGAKEGKGESAP